MKADAAWFFLLPTFPFPRVAFPVRYLRIFSFLINIVSVLYGLLLGSNSLCLKISHSGLDPRYGSFMKKFTSIFATDG